MQQQLLDQFQQAMMAMVQVFGALHRDQMGQVREELDRLRNTTQELHTLRAELARQCQANGPAVNGGAPGRHTPPHPELPGPAPVAPSSPPPAAAPGIGETAGSGDGTIHVWLTERIAALEQEQQSRWQRVMGFVLGK
jgi:hypothetical protein